MADSAIILSADSSHLKFTRMRQQTLADSGFEQFRKTTRRERFLAEMEQVIPWHRLCKVIRPYYSVPEGAGHPPVRLELMLRIHFLQH